MKQEPCSHSYEHWGADARFVRCRHCGHIYASISPAARTRTSKRSPIATQDSLFDDDAMDASRFAHRTALAVHLTVPIAAPKAPQAPATPARAPRAAKPKPSEKNEKNEKKTRKSQHA